MFGLVTNLVDNIVNRDSTDDPIVFVYHRGREQVPVLELPYHLCRWRVGGYRHHVGRHDIGDQRIRIMGEHARQK